MNPLKASASRSLRLNPAAITAISPASRSIASTTRNATSLEPVSRGAIYLPPPQDYYQRKPLAALRQVQRPVSNGFTRLFTDLTHALTRPGLPPSVKELKEIMAAYTSQKTEWEKYAQANDEKPYTRNLVMEVPGVFNLLLLVWNPGMGSPIHDHVGSHCVMRILQGELIEKRYAWPDTSPPTLSPTSALTPPQAQMRELSATTHKEGKVAYMCDAMGLHSIGNPNLPTSSWARIQKMEERAGEVRNGEVNVDKKKDQYSYSLHLYTPPNAALRGCYMFDPHTGAAKHVEQGPYDTVGGRG